MLYAFRVARLTCDPHTQYLRIMFRGPFHAIKYAYEVPQACATLRSDNSTLGKVKKLDISMVYTFIGAVIWDYYQREN
jgi:hypothetical protein